MDKILRVSYVYTKKDGEKVKVPEKYIKDRGNPGKGPKLIPPLKKGEFKKIGYDVNKSNLSRHRALNRGVKEYTKNTMIRRLNAISTLLKNTSPKKSEIFKKDMYYVQRL